MLRSADVTGDKQLADWVANHHAILGRYHAASIETRTRTGENAEWKLFINDNNNTPIARLLRLGDLDACGSMGAALLETILREGKPASDEQQRILQRVAHWIVDQQERLPDGTFWRPRKRDWHNVWPEGTMWADDLYMACSFLVRWSAYTRNDAHLTDAAHQVINMAAQIQDVDGLWFHGYSVHRKERSSFKWGRANGWAIVSTVEILSAMPVDHPDRPRLLEIYRKHVEGLKRVQTAGGMWRQILDRQDLWEETSCSAMFAYAIARGVNRGWLPPSDRVFAERAVSIICRDFVSASGIVKGTCEGTNIGLNLEFYGSRRRPDDDHHGPGAVMLACAEVLDQSRGGPPKPGR